MSYQVLARKWRPQNFSQLVGQDHVKTALINALTTNRLHHAYLFTGTRGVGKTSIARIFAKSLNCETGVTATPCGQCVACREIESGRFVDLLEIDAASRTKVEDTRDLLDNVQYAPTHGRYKVYLIDEVHMLSRHSFNALLKTLEEPPPHVKFLLATTDPQKLPVTVLSRCLQFSLKALSPEQIKQYLAYILQQENIPFEDAALGLLARAAKGSLRDSLSLADQAIAQSNSHITQQTVRDMLGYLEHSWAQLLLNAVLQRDPASLRQHLAELISLHSDFTVVLDDMLSLLHLAALTQLQPEASVMAESQQDYVQTLAQSQPAASIQLYYQLLISGKKELPYAPDAVTGLEMALLRALAFVPVTEKPQASLALPATGNEKNYRPALPQQAAEATASQAEHTVVTAAIAAPQPQIKDTTAPLSIDPVTASIMQRRGVLAPPDRSAPEPAVPEKKSERQQAPSEKQPPVHLSDRLAIEKQASAVIPEVLPESEIPAPETQPVFAEDADIVDNDDTEWQPQSELTESLWQQYQQDAQFTESLTISDEQKFSVRLASEVDPWSRLIESLNTGGLERVFLLNSAMRQQGDVLHLTVTQSQQHLDTPLFRGKLIQALQQAMQRNLTLDIQYQPQVADCPIAIQQRIEQERQRYVLQLLQQDPIVQQLQQQFDATLLPETLQVN